MYLLILCIIGFIIATTITVYKDKGNGNLIYNRVAIVYFIGSIAIYFILWMIVFTLVKAGHMEAEFKEIYVESIYDEGEFTIEEQVDFFILNGQFENGVKKIKISSYNTFVKKEDGVKPHVRNYYVRKTFPPFKTKWIFDRNIKPGEWKINNFEDTEDLVLVIPSYTKFKDIKK